MGLLFCAVVFAVALPTAHLVGCLAADAAGGDCGAEPDAAPVVVNADEEEKDK